MNSFDEIYLETDEEVTSAIDKIKKSKKKTIALCLPRHAVLGQSIINLKLLYKEASASEKNLALVSPDKVTRALAEKVGFTTFEQIGDVGFETPEKASELEVVAEPAPQKAVAKEKKTELTEEKEARELEDEDDILDDELAETDSLAAPAGFKRQSITPPTPSLEESVVTPKEADEVAPEADEKSAKSTPSRQGSMIPTRGNLRFYRQSKRKAFVLPLLIALGLLFASGLGVALAVPQATVTVTVSAQPFNETVNSNVDIDTKEVDVAKSTIPGKLVVVEQETKSSAKATGKKDMGEKATGTVMLVNEWDSLTHTFAAGTKIRAKNGNEYVLADSATLPGATSTLSGGKTVITAGKREVDVVAAAAGDAYNLAPATFSIPSLTKAEQEKIYATSSVAISGGTSKVVTIITQSDIDKLVETLKSKNKDDGIAELKKQAGDAIVLDKAVQQVSQDVVSAVAADTVADSVEATIKGKFQAITFSKDDHNNLLSQLLDSKIPDGQRLVTQGDNVSLDTSQFDLNLVTDKRLELTNNLKAFTATYFDEKLVQRSLTGASPAEVKSLVEKRVPVKDVSVTLTPAKWPRLPLLTSRIKVNYQYSGKES